MLFGKITKSFKVLIFAFSIFLSILINQFPTSALSASNFNPGFIIDDFTFYNKDSMSVAQIQAFLDSKVINCDTNHVGFTGGTGTVYSPPWTCLKDFYENPNSTYNLTYTCQDETGTKKTNTLTYYYNNAYTITSITPIFKDNTTNCYSITDKSIKTEKSPNTNINIIRSTIVSNTARPLGSISASQIIFNAAQKYGINPQVLIVTLQKEQGLITDTWPAAWQYQSAMGYGCPDFKPCASSYSGFSAQIENAAWQFRDYANNPDSYNFKGGTTRYVQYNPTAGCGGTNVAITNQATANLYNYTPYQPNAEAIANMSDSSPGGSVSCGAYGNRNFFWYFTNWFGSTYSNVYNGVDYSYVFDATYYLSNYSDLKAAFGNNSYLALRHFVQSGMREGRQAIASFNVFSYKNTYWDLRMNFGNDLAQYYSHYIYSGKKEGRVATSSEFNGTPVFKGVDYSAVYNYAFYKANNPDVSAAFKMDDETTLRHFVQSGMREGRQAIASFNVFSYKNTYWDLRMNFGNDLAQYYSHYIYSGKKEGRVATSSEFNGTPVFKGVDYSAVYNYAFYKANNPDVSAAFKMDDETTLRHFVQSGMREGRQAIKSFSAIDYKNRYADLEKAFGNDITMYFKHYMYSGVKEGRIGTP